MGWSAVAELIRIVGQPTIVRLMPALRPARAGVLALFFLVRGRRLGRSPRGVILSLKPDHQLNQLVLAQPLRISAIQAPRGFRDCAPRQNPMGEVGNYAIKPHILKRVG